MDDSRNGSKYLKASKNHFQTESAIYIFKLFVLKQNREKIFWKIPFIKWKNGFDYKLQKLTDLALSWFIGGEDKSTQRN